MPDAGDLAIRVDSIEQKIDRLAASAGQRFDDGNRRFDAVDLAIAEQRAYTDFAYEKLDKKIDVVASRLEAKMDAGFSRVDGRLATLEGAFSRFERKLDQLIDRTDSQS